MTDTEANAPVRVLIVVDSWQGHTAHVAEHVIEGVRAEGGEPVLRSPTMPRAPICRQPTHWSWDLRSISAA